MVKKQITYLEIDCKSRDLLRQTKEIDCSIEQVGLKLGVEINQTLLPVDQDGSVSTQWEGRSDQIIVLTAQRNVKAELCRPRKRCG